MRIVNFHFAFTCASMLGVSAQSPRVSSHRAPNQVAVLFKMHNATEEAVSAFIQLEKDIREAPNYDLFLLFDQDRVQVR